MIVFTAHVKPHAMPVLVPERFSWGALVFGPLWLAVNGAWIAAAASLLLWVLLLALIHGPLLAPLALLLAIIFGLFGQDLRRLALQWRGFLMVTVIAGRDQEGALARLLDARPELGRSLL